MRIGSRIIFDQDGEVIVHLSEVDGSVLPRKPISNIDYIDLSYGEVDYSKFRIVAIDTATRTPILEEIPYVKTEEQLRIEELENELLLASGVV